MKRVAIIGATGTVGHGLIQSCMAHGIECYVFLRPDSKRKNVISQTKNIHMVCCGMEDMKDFSEKSLPQIDAFFFLAWQGTFGADARNDMALQVKNTAYAIDAVHLAKRLGCEVFVGAGSQAEYGRVERVITPDMPCEPENGYGMAKLCAGNMTRIECQKLGMRHIWGRILSVYGPCDGENSLVSYAIRTSLKGENPRFTKGEQVWDYLYSEDAGEALCRMGQAGVDGKTYVLGSGRTRTLREFITDICNAANPKVTPEFGAIPYSEKQVMHLEADISQLTEDTGFVPKVTFEDGINRTIEWVKKNV